MWVQALGQEDTLEQGMATHSSILAWRIPWTRNLAGYSPYGCRVRHNWSDFECTHSWCIILYKFSSVAQLFQTLCDPMDCSMPGLPVLYYVPEFAQTHVHWINDAIQPSYPWSSISTPAFSLSQHQGLFQWIDSSHQVAKVLELQFQNQSFQWIFRTDFL